MIVIVPGSKTKESRLPVLRPLLERFYAHFGVQVEGETWLEPLKHSFAAMPSTVIVFEWSGGISPFAIRRAAKELEQLLLNYKDREICLFTKSLGGAVATLAAQNTLLPIKTIAYVATPHFRFGKRVPSSVQVINIYSEADNYQQLANRLLYLGMGRAILPHARNIALPQLRHSDFNHDLEVEYEGRTQKLFTLYRQLLTAV